MNCVNWAEQHTAYPQKVCLQTFMLEIALESAIPPLELNIISTRILCGDQYIKKYL